MSDHAGYRTLLERYAAQGIVLEGRRSRVRNALVHGDPAGFMIVESVRGYAEFLSGGALSIALESCIEGEAPAAALARRTGEFTAMQNGQDTAAYWRARSAVRSAAGTSSA
ncbi:MULTISPECIES: hypothetical protein [unclassified Streptomyces]|uniref:hypothetical protein n=1 Tax=unclassified Streptomyces TaxID=2593676 RepID=UPI0016606FC7|nr:MULTISPECIES: hypothetical protein [unclassified Streptomyces]